MSCKKKKVHEFKIIRLEKKPRKKSNYKKTKEKAGKNGAWKKNENGLKITKIVLIHINLNTKYICN